MSMINSFSVFIVTELKSSNSPMTILVLLLFIMWSISIYMLMMGSSIWGMIYLIMLFMGGLMITYLFIVSMMPKENKSFLNPPTSKMVLLIMVMYISWDTTDFRMNELFNISFWVLFLAMILIMIFVFIIFLLMIDPFKTMKSSF
uniref:NADH dehydrogenase subunit 6 n=1 Tax=Ascoschoengastia sp. TATW-1 TaxID=436354 RepID=B3IUM5_9ACAR|nr:NADH dehydrogenase subunit 6 [Ascoschoengastia sp. TATW-1]